MLVLLLFSLLLLLHGMPFLLLLLLLCLPFIFILSLFFWQKNMNGERAKRVEQRRGAHSTGKNGQIVAAVDFGSNYPNKEVVQHFYNQLNVNVQSIYTYLVWLFYCIITLTARIRTHTCFHRAFIHFFFLYSLSVLCTVNVHTHTRPRIRTFFCSSKKCWKKKTSCVQCRPNRFVSYARQFFFHRKITENRNYFEHLFPSSHNSVYSAREPYGGERERNLHEWLEIILLAVARKSILR